MNGYINRPGAVAILQYAVAQNNYSTIPTCISGNCTMAEATVQTISVSAFALEVSKAKEDEDMDEDEEEVADKTAISKGDRTFRKDVVGWAVAIDADLRIVLGYLLPKPSELVVVG